MKNLTGSILTAILILFTLHSFGQGILKGTVTDENSGETLPGALVQIIGTYKGASTGFDGKYIIRNINPGDYSIKVTYLGYADKIYNGITLTEGSKTLDIKLTSRSQTLDAVEVVGQKTLIDLESGSSEFKIDNEELEKLNTRDIKEVVGLQSGVTVTTDGIQIRGGRNYETQYMVDNVSAQDPLAGTGFGVKVNSASIGSLTLITGGQGAEFGDANSGVISTSIKEGGDHWEIGGNWSRDNLGFDKDWETSWNTDVVALSASGPVPFTKKKLTLFVAGSAELTDTYFGAQADQLRSSLFPNNETLWAPRQDNSFTNTVKLAYTVKPGTKITLTNQHSLKINQNSRTLQIVGFDQILAPGFQFRRSLNLDNATTYTHHSNLTALNLNHFINDRWNLSATFGRLFSNLRADANGRPFREESINTILDEQSIVTDPVSQFNPEDSVVFVLPGPWFINNNGITGVWHDHYTEEYSSRIKLSYYPNNKTHRFTFGLVNKATTYQWVDVFKPWVGAPIVLEDGTTSPSTRIGVSSDIWKVTAYSGGVYAQDAITYNGIVASLGLRLNYWANGKFADNAVLDPNSPVIQQVRLDYQQQTSDVFGIRWKSRLLPKLNVSFPVTDNNVLFFNYGHSMKLPHPRFLYQGLDPLYQQNSFLDDLGNPNLNPEVSVNYELGLKTQVSKNAAFSLSAYNNNRFDYIVSRRVLVEDATGRTVAKRMYINQDYARIYGVEVSAQWRAGKYLSGFGSVNYQVARGKSNSARESSLQIEQNGEVALSKEQFLAWDRPWDIKAGLVFSTDSSFYIGNTRFANYTVFFSARTNSGYRYTPHQRVGENDLGRPLYEIQQDRFLQEIGKWWFNADLKITKSFYGESGRGFSVFVEVRNLFNNKNSQVVNPITGRAWEPGDDVTDRFRDPRYLGPEENGAQPNDPARYLAPRQILYGIAFKL